ncbi:DUF1328 domain-containing protein [Frigidibacter sp. MR17.14]|uniref:DUF1328 domain-containing protein n=1 Tax=Frigidibacter sp. MR17.14 TaxID=3126509 RepID=UPI003012E86D
MLYWAAIFLLVASICGIFGFGGFALGAVVASQVLCLLFLALCLLALGIGMYDRSTG